MCVGGCRRKGHRMAVRSDALGEAPGGLVSAPGGLGRRVSHPQASTFLAGRSPEIARLVELSGRMRLERPGLTHFAALVRSIVHQQLAGAAAVSIHSRVETALDWDVTPERVSATSNETLRAAGLSGAKVASICDLAMKSLDGTVDLNPHRIARASDDAVIRELCEVRGIGVWTAQMFLLFQLRRLDVWPSGDLGVRRGYGLAFDVAMPPPAALEAMGDQFRPYRSVAAWYCWRACDVLGARRSK